MKKLLLHTCCAPCVSYVYEILKDSYDITLFFYNPNIQPIMEYNKRLFELEEFVDNKKIKLIKGEYNSKKWFSEIGDYRFYGERSRRCWLCYRFRLEETFKAAQGKGFDMVGTVLSISPHKNSAILNSIGIKLQEKYNIEFLVSDFKKNDGFKKSLELSKLNGFYRQNYCGCIYSLKERERNSAWYNKFCIENKNLDGSVKNSTEGIF